MLFAVTGMAVGMKKMIYNYTLAMHRSPGYGASLLTVTNNVQTHAQALMKTLAFPRSHGPGSNLLKMSLQIIGMQ